ncbi:MAG TPA: TauD/TfdA family dioxygenase [Gemmataceae bacterium]|nr:TauD/TfdA family dioxygenase [Gemmataceae bacterium]
MLSHTITDARAWRDDTIDDRQTWYYPLSRRCLEALDETVRRLRRQPRPTTEVRADEEPCTDCAEELQPVRAALENGRGFAILQGPARDRYSPQEMQVCYWLIGQLLGRPIEQNVQGTLLYDVRDTGQDVRYGARFSVTKAESSFHTDNSFGVGVADYVGLLCIEPARSGGLSQVVSGYSIHNELLACHRDVLEVLYQPLHIDRRGGTRPGEPPTVRHPVLSWDGCGLLYRYLRYWIESGHEKIGQPLSDAQRRALDLLDEAASQPSLRVEFALRPGDLFFVNNRWILHNRTAFEDHAEPEQRRHLVRLWLEAGPSNISSRLPLFSSTIATGSPEDVSSG